MPQDYVHAFNWYRLAAEQGLAGAQYNLGLMYETGKGVVQDEVQAYLWFTRTASRSTNEQRARAIKKRDDIYGRLTVAQRAESQRLAQEWNEAHPRWAITDLEATR